MGSSPNNHALYLLCGHRTQPLIRCCFFQTSWQGQKACGHLYYWQYAHHSHKSLVPNAQFNTMSRWQIVSSGHSTILYVDSANPVNIDYLPVEYCLGKGFQFLIPSRDDWNNDTVVTLEVLDTYTDSSIIDNEVKSGVYSGKLDPNISPCLPDYWRRKSPKKCFLYFVLMSGLGLKPWFCV